MLGTEREWINIYPKMSDDRAHGSKGPLLAQLLPFVEPGLATQVHALLRDRRASPSDLVAEVLIANDTPLPEAVLRLFDAPKHTGVDPISSTASVVVQVAGRHRVVLWRGDITSLGVGAVVNAANTAGLGCFQPSHRCVDNVIHRAAGPRLREACRAAMAERHGLPLTDVPIDTPGFNLPASRILHVTGPQLTKGAHPTPAQRTSLASCYTNCLVQAATKGIRSVAFPCISSGLFCFPQAEAAEIASSAVLNWLLQASGDISADGGAGMTVVFCVFTERDEELYRALWTAGLGAAAEHPGTGRPSQLKLLPVSARTGVELLRAPPSSAERAMAAARSLFGSCSRVLICAGAGMSVKPPEALENVYVDPVAFAHHYPLIAKHYGYRTAYECMGLLGDKTVPDTVKWGFWAAHWHNMRWGGFTPGAAYKDLLTALQTSGKDYFVYTSNVDGAFERAGFDSKRIYAVQGDMAFYQCVRPCSQEAVFPSGPLIASLRAQTDSATGRVPESAVPRCPRCGAGVFINVRGGDWFLPTQQAASATRLQRWLAAGTTPGAPRTLIIEVGAGFNTPTVTRLPMEALARQEPAFTLLRVNPDAAGVPEDLLSAGKAVSVARGNDVLAEIVTSDPGAAATSGPAGDCPTEASGTSVKTKSTASELAVPVSIERGGPMELPWQAYFANLSRLPRTTGTSR